MLLRAGSTVFNLMTRALPKGWLDALRQIAIWFLADAAYETVRGFVAGKAALAFSNARGVIKIERSLHIFAEPQVQAFFIPDHRWVVDIADFIYVNGHFVLTSAFVFWVYLRRNTAFYFVRNVFLVSMGLCIAIQAGIPTAPPRLFPNLGFIDTIHKFAHINQDTGDIKALINSYAAVPSMHVAFALIVGVSGIMLTRRWALRLLWACYPLLITFVVVVTANHFFFDAATGAMATVFAVAVARWPLTAARPDHWAFRLQPNQPREKKSSRELQPSES
jgi:hypothetical protein